MIQGNANVWRALPMMAALAASSPGGFRAPQSIYWARSGFSRSGELMRFSALSRRTSGPWRDGNAAPLRRGYAVSEITGNLRRAYLADHRSRLFCPTTADLSRIFRLLNSVPEISPTTAVLPARGTSFDRRTGDIVSRYSGGGPREPCERYVRRIRLAPATGLAMDRTRSTA